MTLPLHQLLKILFESVDVLQIDALKCISTGTLEIESVALKLVEGMWNASFLEPRQARDSDLR